MIKIHVPFCMNALQTIKVFCNGNENNTLDIIIKGLSITEKKFSHILGPNILLYINKIIKFFVISQKCSNPVLKIRLGYLELKCNLSRYCVKNGLPQSQSPFAA